MIGVRVFGMRDDNACRTSFAQDLDEVLEQCLARVNSRRSVTCAVIVSVTRTVFSISRVPASALSAFATLDWRKRLRAEPREISVGITQERDIALA